jgi:insecticidal toxin complex protein TccC
LAKANFCPPDDFFKLQSNTLELDDQAQTFSYEHYYPYGGTALIAGKDKTKGQQKR